MSPEKNSENESEEIRKKLGELRKDGVGVFGALVNGKWVDVPEDIPSVRIISIKKGLGYGDPYHVLTEDGKELVNMGVTIKLKPRQIPVAIIEVPLWGGIDLDIPENLITYEEMQLGGSKKEDEVKND